MNELIQYMKIYLISLEQDSEEVERALDEQGADYATLDIESISLNGQIIATRHLLSVADDILLKTNEGE